MFINIPFLIFMVWDFSIKIESACINICTKFSNCWWMKMAKISLSKGLENGRKSGKKSVKSQGILKRILSGNPVWSFVIHWVQSGNSSLTRSMPWLIWVFDVRTLCHNAVPDPDICCLLIEFTLKNWISL